MKPPDCPPLQPLCSSISTGLDLASELERSITHAWVATRNSPLNRDQPCEGFCLIWQVVDELELVAVGTQLSSRRRGIARALLAEMVDFGRASKCRRATLEVSSDNAPAVTLYRSLGFEVFNTRKGYYRARAGRPQSDALEMELEF